VWCQEEPKNQGAWSYMAPYLHELITKDQALRVCSRPDSASPAVGYYQKHIDQLQTLVNEALG
jgi:2-oxoglutarate dehydrogenase E1 component